MRHHVFSEFPLHAQLQEYPKLWREIEEQNVERFWQWQKASGMSAEKFSSLFTPENTGYAPIRKRDGIGKTGTFEIRTCDSTPLQYALGTMAVYKGCNDFMLQENIAVEVAQRKGEYEFSERGVVLPTLRTLQMLEYEAIRYGMTSKLMKEYVGKVVRFAEKGLNEAERKYLLPVQEMVESGVNPSTKVNRFLRRDGYMVKQFTPERAAEGNIFLRELYKEGLQN
jgi:gamma-glutamyl:cysteine ligase YbdK (ATP-grasp superfamily)